MIFSSRLAVPCLIAIFAALTSSVVVLVYRTSGIPHGKHI
jgi:hypothetical protein